MKTLLIYFPAASKQENRIIVRLWYSLLKIPYTPITIFGIQVLLNYVQLTLCIMNMHAMWSLILEGKLAQHLAHLDRFPIPLLQWARLVSNIWEIKPISFMFPFILLRKYLYEYKPTEVNAGIPSATELS